MAGSRSESADSFDYVVVGAGAAGSILAGRLTEDPGTTICLLEAGPRDWHPLLHIPAGFIKVIFDPAFTWQFSSEPTSNTGNRRVPIPVGRTLGGSTAINGLVYNRGQPADFAAWAAAGNRGWGYADVLPYFKRSERKIGVGDDAFHGRTGEQPVTDMDWIHPICEAFITGSVGFGMPRNSDYNGASQLGVGYYQRTILNGWRQSAARSFLAKAKQRKNLDIRKNAQATAILFDDQRARGVRYWPGGGHGAAKIVRARREVILSCGALNTPKLLQLSGVGPAPLLQSLGIPLVRESPGVGEHLRDHYSVRIVARVTGIDTINELSSGWRLGREFARWLLGRPNVLALSPSLVHWFWKSRQELNAPDMQGVFTPASYRDGYVGRLDDYPGMTCGVWQHRPRSVGYVRARSADPADPPIVQPNYLENERDVEVLLSGLHTARQLLRSPQLAKFFDSETLPGSAVTTDDELLAYARRVGVSCYHVNGTARMSPANDPSAVVDDALRVRGISGLRVVDASVMPDIPSANTCATTMMIAEKAADMIRGRPPLPAEISDAYCAPGAQPHARPASERVQ
ncbi:MAG: GMC family oxidoreductase [Acetobacteraceae bacterium]